MVGCGQQRGRMGTQVATEFGNKELTDDWVPGRGGDSSPLGLVQGELQGGRQEESLWSRLWWAGPGGQ